MQLQSNEFYVQDLKGAVKSFKGVSLGFAAMLVIFSVFSFIAPILSPFFGIAVFVFIVLSVNKMRSTILRLESKKLTLVNQRGKEQEIFKKDVECINVREVRLRASQGTAVQLTIEALGKKYYYSGIASKDLPRLLQLIRDNGYNMRDVKPDPFIDVATDLTAENNDALSFGVRKKPSVRSITVKSLLVVGFFAGVIVVPILTNNSMFRPLAEDIVMVVRGDPQLLLLPIAVVIAMSAMLSNPSVMTISREGVKIASSPTQKQFFLLHELSGVRLVGGGSIGGRSRYIVELQIRGQASRYVLTNIADLARVEAVLRKNNYPLITSF